MLTALGLGVLFKAKDEASEVIEKLHEGVDELGHAAHKSSHSVTEALGMSGKAIAGTAIAIGAIAAGGAFEFAEHAEKFSRAILQAGVAAHATTEEIHHFEEAARARAFDDMRGSAIETAETLKELALEGYSLNESMDALSGTLDIMRITSMSSRDAASLVNDTLSQFHMRADQATELSDKLAFAMRTFGFRAEELAPAMAGLASGASLVGASFDDALIGVGLIKNVFPSATKAAQGMNIALQQLASTHTQKELAGIGVTVKDTHGKMRPLLEIIQDLSGRTAKLSDAQLANKLASIGSARAAGGLAIILDSLRKGVTDSSGKVLTGAAALAYYRDQLEHTQGTAKRMAALLGSDMGSALSALKGALSNAGVALGSMFEGGFTKAIQTLNLFVRALTQVFTQGGFSGDVKDALDKRLGLKEFVVTIFLWVERIKNFLGNLKDSFLTAFAPFQPVLDMLLTSFGVLAQALGLTSQTADDNASKWDSFGAAGKNVGEILANLAGAVIPVVITGVTLLVGAVEVVKAAWDELGPAISAVGQTLSGLFKMIAGLFTADWKMMWDGFVDTAAGAAQMVVRLVMGVIGWFGKLIDSVGSAFGKDFGLAKEIDELKKDWSGSLVEGTQVIKSVVSPTAGTGSAAIQSQAAATAAAQAKSGGAATEGGGSAGGVEEHHHHVSLHVDGEKLAEVHAQSKRSAGARSFQSVPAEAGGF